MAWGVSVDTTILQTFLSASACTACTDMVFFLSFVTGSLIHEHYTRECKFGNFDK